MATRSRLTPDEETQLRSQVAQDIDQARRGSPQAAKRVAQAMARLGCFDGPHARCRRLTYGQWLEGTHPDVAAEGWALYLAAGGGR